MKTQQPTSFTVDLPDGTKNLFVLESEQKRRMVDSSQKWIQTKDSIGTAELKDGKFTLDAALEGFIITENIMPTVETYRIPRYISLISQSLGKQELFSKNPMGEKISIFDYSNTYAYEYYERDYDKFQSRVLPEGKYIVFRVEKPQIKYPCCVCGNESLVIQERNEYCKTHQIPHVTATFISDLSIVETPKEEKISESKVSVFRSLKQMEIAFQSIFLNQDMRIEYFTADTPKYNLFRNKLTNTISQGYELVKKQESLGDKFLAHLESHLKNGEVAICKICDKTVDEICETKGE